MKELALDLHAKFYQEKLSVYENRYSHVGCCLDTLIKHGKDLNNQELNCECGSVLNDEKFYNEDFEYYIHGLYSTDYNNYGEGEYASNRSLVRAPWHLDDLFDTPRDQIHWIKEHAEQELLAALLKEMPELNAELESDI